jgi:putative drug exporter of the RND superfamily
VGVARGVGALVSGRRPKWPVVAAWIVLVVALAPVGAKLGDVTES